MRCTRKHYRNKMPDQVCPHPHLPHPHLSLCPSPSPSPSILMPRYGQSWTSSCTLTWRAVRTTIAKEKLSSLFLPTPTLVKPSIVCIGSESCEGTGSLCSFYSLAWTRWGLLLRVWGRRRGGKKYSASLKLIRDQAVSSVPRRCCPSMLVRVSLRRASASALAPTVPPSWKTWTIATWQQRLDGGGRQRCVLLYLRLGRQARMVIHAINVGGLVKIPMGRGKK